MRPYSRRGKKLAMRSGIRLCLFSLIALPLLLMSPALAQQIGFFPSFSNSSPNSVNNLRFNGNSSLAIYQSQTVLRLTDSGPGAEQSSTWFQIQQPVGGGFSTWFQFQVHNNVCCAPTDGFAFVLQNSNNTDSSQGASGRGVTALGAAGGGLGYSGINNSLAVEFDVYDDPWDPNSNHIAIQSCGGNPALFNSPVHIPGNFTIGNNHNVTSCLLSQAAINTGVAQLGGSCNQQGCTDGSIHQVVIEYTPPAANQQQGMLQVWLDPVFFPGTHTPALGQPTVLSVPYNIVYSSTNTSGLVLSSTSGGLWAGFTGGQTAGAGSTQDIFAWEFTLHQAVQVTLPIPNGGVENDFSFGGHQMGVTYPTQINGNGLFMTVLATPWDEATFYNQRLLGTPFANENCITYLQTGGDCIVYSVTCQDQNGNNVTCPTSPQQDPPIAICSEFYTAQPVAIDEVDFLEAEPIGSNNWCSIYYSFMQNPLDPVVSGKGRGFSDVVATLTENRQGPQCNSGDALKHWTQQIQKSVTPQPGFCPAFQQN